MAETTLSPLNPDRPPVRRIALGVFLTSLAVAEEPRKVSEPSVLREPSEVVQVVDAFDDIGWQWGGDWTSRKDYHHFAIEP